jgi:hypothetical protein
MSALRQAFSVRTLSPSEWQFLRTIADDTEDAPWVVMSEPQWRSASALFWSLDVYAQTHSVAWHPGAMLPLTYRPPGARRRRQVAPDVFARCCARRARKRRPARGRTRRWRGCALLWIS